MKKLIAFSFLLIIIAHGCDSTPVEPIHSLYKDLKFRKLVILKADDFKFNSSHNVISNNWNRYIQYILSENIKSSIGIVGNSLENNSETYFSLIKYMNETGSFEFWNHGYNHVLNVREANGKLFDEFQNSGLNYQIDHLQWTQDLGEKKLNIKFRAFGAPGNAIDRNTPVALDLFSDIKVWFFGAPGSDKVVLKRQADAENTTGNPDFTYFTQHFNVTEDYVVLQLHPNQWNERQFDEFKSIISFLKYNECTFILPSEYENL